MNLEEARILADKVVRMRDPSLATEAITESLAESVLELADEVRRLQFIELAARALCESAGPLVEMPGYEFVESDKMSMLLSALYGPDEELMYE